jgi:hypothetical protein
MGDETMDTVAEFVSATHTRVRGQKMPELSIGIASAKNIAERIDWDRMAQIAESAKDYLPQVLEELESLKLAKQNTPQRLARRIFLFGISTPNRSEDQSIAYALAAEPYYGVLSAEDMSRLTVTFDSGKQGNMGFYTSLERSISDGYALLGELDRPAWLESTYLTEQIRGVGPKVARMMSAIAYPHGYQWTVDLWHGRQLLWAAGLNPVARVSIDAGAYSVCQSVWLDYADRFFADTPTFAVQWATWCAAEGRFVSHKALWADLA